MNGLARDPNSLAGMAQFASMYFRRQQFEPAIGVLKLLAQAHPNAWDVLLNLARVYDASGQQTLAVDAYRRALALNPDLTEARTRLNMLQR